jgi:metacaspase-1
MAKGVSLHIGLNSVDPDHYQGWDGALNACENDARDMQKIADGLGYSSKLQLTPEGTAENVSRAIEEAAGNLEPGDVFWLTYSGHGGQIPDRNGDEATQSRDELGEFADEYDETWVLFDRQLIDDELYALWNGFARGVRIIILSDSCHSGTVARPIIFTQDPDTPVGRRMPLSIEDRTYQANQEMYDEIQRRVPSRGTAGLQATVALISGCMDNQTSADGRVNGRFTGRLLEVWSDGAFRGDVSKLRDAIAVGMPSDQTPNYYVVGPRDPALLERQAFEI